MRRIDRDISSVDVGHKRETYIGPIASTSNGGRDTNVNNLYNSQINSKSVMPYGISSRGMSGMKAQTIVNGNSDNVTVGVYDPNRPDVGVGEICLYSSGGCSIYLSSNGAISIDACGCGIDILKNKISIKDGGSEVAVRSGSINIKSGDTNVSISSGGINIESSSDINITCPTLKVDGSVEITGDLKVNDQTMIVP